VKTILLILFLTISYLMLTHILISVLAGYGLAVVLVEKQKQWPVRRFAIIAKLMLHKIHHKLPQMLDCTVCTSFWTTLVFDLILCVFGLLHGECIFTWPISGFIAAGFTWTIMDILISFGGMATK
jgi:hypothetical protein